MVHRISDQADSAPPHLPLLYGSGGGANAFSSLSPFFLLPRLRADWLLNYQMALAVLAAS